MPTISCAVASDKINTTLKKIIKYNEVKQMLEILFTIIFIALFVWTLRLMFRISWGIAKILATVLLVLAIPALVLCLIFAGGLALLIPIGIVAGVVGIIKLFT